MKSRWWRHVPALLAMLLLASVLPMRASAVNVYSGGVPLVAADEDLLPTVSGASMSADVVNYFQNINAGSGEGTSGNGHYIVDGVYFDGNENAYVVIRLAKNSNFKAVTGIKINDGAPISNPVYRGPTSGGQTITTLTLHFPDGTQYSVSSKDGVMVIRLGPVSLDSSYTFRVSIDTDTATEFSGNAWDVNNMPVTLRVNDSVEKDVDRTAPVRAGDSIIYTVTVSNASDSSFALSDVDVYDILPDGLQDAQFRDITDGTGGDYVEAEPDADRRFYLATGIALGVGASRTYEVKAVVSDHSPAGTLTNTAYIHVSGVEKHDSADITVQKYATTVRKRVVNQTTDAIFPFEAAIVTRGDGTDAVAYPLPTGDAAFGLGHDATHAIGNLPARPYWLRLKETADATYAVTVAVDGVAYPIGDDGYVYIPLEDANGKTITFTNTYACVDVTISKQVTGSMGDVHRDFAFSVTPDSPLTIEAATDGSYALTKNEDGKVTEITFRLKHGESVVLPGIPIGTQLTITETDSAGYDVYVNGVKIAGRADPSATDELTVTDADRAVTFRNDRDAVPDTGIRLDSLPYIAVLALVATQCAWQAIRRKRRED